jgi:hypothetical protein
MTINFQTLVEREELQAHDDQNKIKTVLRKIAFLKENKWLKDEELISRYKSKRDLDEYLTAGFNKIIYNMVKSTIAPLLVGLPWTPSLRKRGTSAGSIIFLDGHGYLGWRPACTRGSQRLHLQNHMRPLLENAFAALNAEALRHERYTFQHHNLHSNGNFEINFGYSRLALLGGASLRTLEEFRADVATLTNIIRASFAHFQIAGPVVAEPVAETPVVPPEVAAVMTPAPPAEELIAAATMPESVPTVPPTPTYTDIRNMLTRQGTRGNRPLAQLVAAESRIYIPGNRYSDD